ncbi:MAG: hypothetical protein ACFB9M_20565 [Myxococcota bacterium]
MSVDVSDLKRLKRELRIMYESLDDELADREPALSRRARKEQVRSRLLAMVDEAVRDVTSEY